MRMIYIIEYQAFSEIFPVLQVVGYNSLETHRQCIGNNGQSEYLF